MSDIQVGGAASTPTHMEKTSTCRCVRRSFTKGGSFSSPALVALVLCVATSLIVTGTLLAFLRSEGPSQVSQRTLTFEQRLSYQRAIEEVYWRHGLWPQA